MIRIFRIFFLSLTTIPGQEWKAMRTFLSPAFTSSKIRLMVPFIEEVGRQTVESLKLNLKNSQTDYIDVDCKDLTTRSSNDVIASCAFGLKVNSYTERNNQFYKMGKLATTFKLKQFIIFFTYAAFPSLFKILKLTLITKETTKFFKDLVLNTMKEREARNIIRPDLIHLLMEAKKGRLRDDNEPHNPKDKFAIVKESEVKKNIYKVWSETDLVAQAVIFLVAGFETVSTALTFTLYELAVNQEVQMKLAQEIKDFDEKLNGTPDYCAIQDMAYMDMVISEVLRLWPPLTILDRECTKNYSLGTPNNNAAEDFIVGIEVKVRKGEVVIISVWSLHRDPQYFPYPEKLDPQRFSEENKHLINRTTHVYAVWYWT